MTSLLDVSELVVKRGPGPVLHGVSLHVNAGEVVGVLGPNGAGKTTLLETIAGLHRPASGTVAFDGDVISGLKPQTIATRGIRLVPEGRRLFGRLTVEENLRIGAEGGGLSDWRWVLEVFPQLTARLNNRGGALSGGEQQMVAIGRALVGKPRLMILDEPSWGLAPLMVEGVLKAIREIRALGTTIVLVEQNVDSALKVVERAYILSGGEVTRCLGRDEALEQPQLLQEAYFSAQGSG